ncbi:unnamed protein product, partial [marine sediment metagenome]
DHQIFVTTHSSVFVSLADFAQIYQIRKIDGFTSCDKKETSDFGDIALELGISPVDIYMTGGLVFVEGECDEIILQHWAKLCNKIFRPPILRIIPIEGVGNAYYQAKIWKNVVDSIKLPMIWLFDGDVKKELLDELNRIGISDSFILVLQKATIEDYYPIEP